MEEHLRAGEIEKWSELNIGHPIGGVGFEIKIFPATLLEGIRAFQPREFETTSRRLRAFDANAATSVLSLPDPAQLTQSGKMAEMKLDSLTDP